MLFSKCHLCEEGEELQRETENKGKILARTRCSCDGVGIHEAFNTATTRQISRKDIKKQAISRENQMMERSRNSYIIGHRHSHIEAAQKCCNFPHCQEGCLHQARTHVQRGERANTRTQQNRSIRTGQGQISSPPKNRQPIQVNADHRLS